MRKFAWNVKPYFWLWANSTDDKLIFFLFFLENKFFTICMNCQSLFFGKKFEKYFKMLSAGIFTQHVLRIAASKNKQEGHDGLVMLT